MTLIAPPAFHPPSSLLGRLVRRWAKDGRQAESLYIVVAALVLVGVTLAGQWGWVLWGLAPDGSPNVAYFAAQFVGGLVVGGSCLLGWRRPVRVEIGDDGIQIARGPDTLTLVWKEIDSAERIYADAYYRHWRRYTATRVFVNRTRDDLLLLRTAEGPVVLGLPDAEFARLDALLAEHLEPAVPRYVRAA